MPHEKRFHYRIFDGTSNLWEFFQNLISYFIKFFN